MAASSPITSTSLLASSAPATPVAPAPELDRPFRLLAFDWDGTAVASRTADASRVAGLLDALLALGTRIAIVTGTSFTNVAHQLRGHIRPENARCLYVCSNRGSEVFGFDRRGERVTLWKRVASPDEEHQL